MRPDLYEGMRLFNAGEYWEAHEAWEAPWREATGSDRHFLQALILLAAAMHKRWAHGSLTERNLHKARRYLAELPALYDGVNLQALDASVEAALQREGLRPQLPGGGLLGAGERPADDTG